MGRARRGRGGPCRPQRRPAAAAKPPPAASRQRSLALAPLHCVLLAVLTLDGVCCGPRSPAADQMCLFCYNQILDEAAKASLAAKCPNCRSEYDEEKIKMQHIDAEQ